MAGNFLELSVGEVGLIDFKNDAGDFLVDGGHLERGDEVELGEGAARAEVEIEEAAGRLTAFGQRTREVVNRNGLGGENGREEGEEKNEDFHEF